MDNKFISGWVRQARYRARKHGVSSDITLEDVFLLLQEHQQLCAFCGDPATALDHLFPLKDGAPNVPANAVPVCGNCKKLKCNNDLVWMFSGGHLDRERYLALLQLTMARRGGTLVKELVRRATGISDE